MRGIHTFGQRGSVQGAVPPPTIPPPRSTMTATPPLEPAVVTIKPADDDHEQNAQRAVDAAIDGTSRPDTISLDAIKAAIQSRANEASHHLDDLRKHRAQFNGEVKVTRARIEREIRQAVAELAEAKRIANSLTPRKPRTKKAPK